MCLYSSVMGNLASLNNCPPLPPTIIGSPGPGSPKDVLKKAWFISILFRAKMTFFFYIPMLMLKMKSSRQMASEQWKFQPQERRRKWAFCSKGWSHQDCGIWLANVLYFEWGLTRALCETIMWFCGRYLPYFLLRDFQRNWACCQK